MSVVKKSIWLLLGLIGLLILGDWLSKSSLFYSTRQADLERSGIGFVSRPPAIAWGRGQLGALPSYDPKVHKPWQVDLRSYDLSDLDVTRRLNDLLAADFDSRTRWPPKLPQAFDPQRILAFGQNPGLGVRQLHQRGVTGKGIGLAIVDNRLFVDHDEYRHRLKAYEEIHCWRMPQLVGEGLHGEAVASIAVGKKVGVAPGADLYYIAQTPGTWSIWSFGLRPNLAWVAGSIERVIEMNKQVPDGRKIRVLSISLAWESFVEGYPEVVTAIKKAEQERIFVVSGWLPETHGFHFRGLGRAPPGDPDGFPSYGPGHSWEAVFYAGQMDRSGAGTLLVPMDSRTTASPTGASDYVFYRFGGLSWSVPYIAGLYALACQIRPDMDPATFWRAALATGRTVPIGTGPRQHALGRICDPVALMAYIGADSRSEGTRPAHR